MKTVSLSVPQRSRTACGSPARRGRPPKTCRAGPSQPPAARLLEKQASSHVVEVVESYFDAEGRPIKRKSLGAARVARSYDAKGNQVEEAYFNVDGAPTPRKGLGAARIHWRYDSCGNKVEAELFGPDGALMARQDEVLLEDA